jgi:hypothetical protein
MATDAEVAAWLSANPQATTAEITAAAASAGVPLSQVAAVQQQIFDPYTSSINPVNLGATQKLDINNLPSTYGRLYDGTGGDTGADPTATGYFSTNEIVNGLPVTAYYDAQGNLTKYVGNATQNLSDTYRQSAEWDPTGKAKPVNWSVDNGLFNSGITFDDATKAAILAMVAAGTLGGPTPTGAEAGTTTAATGAPTGGSTMLNYGAPTSTGGLGLQGTAALDGTLASGLAAPAGGSLGGGLGLTAGAAGNIAAMGGAQGLLANAAGGGVLSAGGVNTGLFTAANLASTLAGGGSAAATLTDTLKNLTPAQVTQLAKAGISVAGLLGTGAAVKGITNMGGGGSGVTLNPQDRSGVSSGTANYSPEYYQAIQAKYNQLMPTTQPPRDVTTDLKSWYETKYAPKVTQ